MAFTEFILISANNSFLINYLTIGSYDVITDKLYHKWLYFHRKLLWSQDKWSSEVGKVELPDLGQLTIITVCQLACLYAFPNRVVNLKCVCVYRISGIESMKFKLW